MQHERFRHPTGPTPAGNAGDVLASIRRLIAQDQGQSGNSPMPTSGPGVSSPFMLGRKDMLRVPTPAEPAERQAAARRVPHAVDGADASHKDRTQNWQSPASSDWPRSAPTTPIEPYWNAPPAAATTAAGPDGAPNAPGQSNAPAHDLADEAEFAEAEAALARMVAPRKYEATPNDVAPQTQHAALSEDMPPTKETPMAQDMRMMNMGGADSFSTMQSMGMPDAATDRAAASSPITANLFGEIGGIAKDATLRVLIRDAIQQELHGELGARLSRNMCQMIRQEVEAVIREICAES